MREEGSHGRGGVGEVDRGAGKAGRDLPPEIDGEVSCEMTSLKRAVGPTWRRLSSVERWASHDLWQSDELWCHTCGRNSYECFSCKDIF